MHIVVAGKQVETGEALKVHVADGLQLITGKYFDHALEAQVTFSKDAKGKQGAFFACDINLHAGRNINVRGEGLGTDAHKAFDEAAAHVAKRLRRYRRRVNEHSRSFADERLSDPVEELSAQEAADAKVAEETAGGALLDEKSLEGKANGHVPSTIVAENTPDISRLTVREAVIRMDLASAPVLMFRNRAHGQLNVVYRRPDGHVGWIDPGA